MKKSIICIMLFIGSVGCELVSDPTNIEVGSMPEYSFQADEELEEGQTLTVEVFEEGERVDIVGGDGDAKRIEPREKIFAGDLA